MTWCVSPDREVTTGTFNVPSSTAYGTQFFVSYPTGKKAIFGDAWASDAGAETWARYPDDANSRWVFECRNNQAQARTFTYYLISIAS